MAVVNGTNGIDTLDGTSGADRLYGLESDDTLNGLEGNDTLDGGSGADEMSGGTGDDLYLVDNAGDVVTENAGEGRDRVQATISYTLGAEVEDLTLAGTDAIDATGNALNNTLIGNKADNTLDGGIGADYMDGGTGNDTYIVDDVNDVIKDRGGFDTVESSVSYTLPTRVEHLILTGVADIHATGDRSNNTLTGNAGNNTLDGDRGRDTMIGGAGDDTYVVDNAKDVIIEQVGEGIDTVVSSFAMTLGDNLENLTLSGTKRMNGTGNALDNILTGNTGDNTLQGLDGNDTLIGGGGKDTLIGGTGDDVYVVDNTTTAVIEQPGAGTDTLRSSVTHALMDNVENLELTGTEAINGTGNALDNTLTGNGAANTLDGGMGADVMIGGDGDDVYIVDNAGDAVTEGANAGEDTVRTSISYTLAANLENIVLTGAADIDATGNSADNTLIGNSGLNTLTGGDGNDVYVIQNSSAVIVEALNEGQDRVEAAFDYTLGANIENLTLTGAAHINGIGNGLDNTLVGNAGNNTLDGGTGADEMAGGLGNDVFIVDDAGDVVTEDEGEGLDTVFSSVSFEIGENIENLSLTGVADIDGTGNDLDNIISGNDGANTLDGGAGADILVGGLGDDTYVVDDLGDAIVDTGGTDTVETEVSWLLQTGLENLTLTGSGTVNATGNSAVNTLTGNTGGNTLDGMGGADTMIGGTGDDTYIVDNAGDVVTENADEGEDTVISAISYTLSADVDNIRLSGAADIDATGNALKNTLIGNSGINTLAGGDGDDVYVIDSLADTVVELGGEGTDTIRTAINLTLTAEVENLVLTGISALSGTGNALDNSMKGNDGINTLDGADGNDTLDGGKGADLLIGGTGDDVFIVDNANDQLVELAAEGTDEVQSAISWTLADNFENLTLLDAGGDINATGNAGVNTLTGNMGDNTLDGRGGADTMDGGGGDDTFFVDDVGDVVIAGSGHDTVYASISYTMASTEDELILTGTAANATGNAEDNIIRGNIVDNNIAGGNGDDTLMGDAGSDVLSGDEGDDTLDGGTGADTMDGGIGDDVYYVDSSLDQVTELLDEGEDLVNARSTYTIGANIENLTLLGEAQLDGTGNTLDNTLKGNAARNTLWGLEGNDRLDGGAGADRMIGGTGNDTYIVDNEGDTIQEFGGEGTDTARASVNYTLASYVERLVLTGEAAINGTGNGVDNGITGNDAANVLDGRGGNDTLDGGKGDDTLIGDDGDDTLDGGEGADTMIGGAGNDVFIVDNDGDVVSDTAGIDKVLSSVSYVMADGIEELELTDTGDIHGTGNALNNTITGNEGDNTIDGGAGADTMVGGDGNDVYVVDNINDIVIETGNVGDPSQFSYVVNNITITVTSAGPRDRVESSVSYILPTNVEILLLTGTAAINGTGHSGNNVLAGNAAKNTLAGGLGNDLYILTDKLDVLVENSGEGIDTVGTILDYTLLNNFENLILIEGSGSIDGTGNNANNTITGNEGANTMRGLGGDDVYVVGEGDVVIEGSGGGYDSVIASANWTLGDNLEDLYLDAEAGAINGTGNALVNILVGNDAANTLDGGAGADTMFGGAGDDTYIVDNAGDVLSELVDEGEDTVVVSTSYTLAANFENLILSGSGNYDGTGNAADNSLTGNSGRNTLTGGDGDDVYVVQNSNDVVVEQTDEGTDKVFASASFTLGDFIEELTLTGTDRINGTGNNQINTLTGNDADNTLSGLGGDDTLDGGIGADRMLGGAGNDEYYVDNLKDVVLEQAGEGTDLVYSTVSFRLGANVENLTLAGDGNITGTGNELDNILIGNDSRNSLSGGAGNDVLDGGGGIDIMDGGAGDDMYYVDDSGDQVKDVSGIDTVESKVNYVLGKGIENLQLTEGDINGTGNELDNTIVGTSGDNTLDGGKGADTLEGGGGNDTYIVDNVGDVVIDGGGVDDVSRVISSVTYALSASVENLTLTGRTALDGTGNAGDNWLLGNDGINRLYGLDGDDTLDGGRGNDTMYGGDGDDIYYVDSTSDVAVEAFGEGNDTVYSAVSYVLGDFIEKLVLDGKSAKVGTGNSLDNVLIGNSGINTLIGHAGSDMLDGGAGADKMYGGIGDDTYVVDNAKDLVSELAGEGEDTVQSWISYTLGAALENLYLMGADDIHATGNDANNDIFGNAGNNTIDGGAGLDRLVGGLGDDTYIVDSAGDTVLEFADEGIDTVLSGVSYDLFVNLENLVLTGDTAINGTGNVLDNILTGNDAVNTLAGLDGNDTLDGGLGADTLAGGAGDDLYYVDDALDVIVEFADEGIDTVIAAMSYTLGAQVENLTLTGRVAANATGNMLNNTLVGNDAVNVLDGGAGDDYLDGGKGTDTMIGGLGNDTFVLDSKRDVVIENPGEGNDTIIAGFTYTLDDVFENLTLLEGARGKQNAFGNAADNVLQGNSNINTLNGLAGADSMYGGGGNDVYFVDDANDLVIENADEGIDTVNAGVSFVMGDHIEKLVLTGTGNIDGTGNALSNTITGNNGDNTLDGGLGADTLDGGAGNDTYIVDDAGDVLKDRSGTETVIASVSWKLANGFENLTLAGAADLSGIGNSAVNTLTGNDGNNTLDGGSGNDTLIGGFGADRLIGGSGSDNLMGGEGDDIYVIDTLGDVIVENVGEGVDTVETTVSYTLGTNLENLVLSGNASISGTGNALNNVLTGNRGTNTLAGGDGNDTLEGGMGNDRLDGGDGDDFLYGQHGSDILTGGTGTDTFVFEAATAYNGRDTLTDFNTGEGDVLDLRDLLEMYDPLTDALSDFVRIQDSGADALVSVDRDGTGNSANWVQIATLQDVNGLDDIDALVLAGNLLAG